MTAAVANAGAMAKPYKLADGEGLHLLVKPSGSKLWRWKYRFAGKEGLLALGVFPKVSLADARALHAEARALLLRGVDPGAARKESKAAAIAQVEAERQAAREAEEAERQAAMRTFRAVAES